MKANRKDINTARKGVRLEHRHFAFVAATLKVSKPLPPWSGSELDQWEGMVRDFADACNATNGRFQRDRFLAACGFFDGDTTTAA